MVPNIYHVWKFREDPFSRLANEGGNKKNILKTSVKYNTTLAERASIIK